ncbi:ferric-chelate reductase Frp1 [Rhizina undulata]
MDMSMDTSSDSLSGGPDLSDAGMDMTNYTVAYDFLQAILDDSILQPYDYAVARAFWYGIVIVIAIAAVANLTSWATLKARIRAAAANRPRSASPSNPVTSTIASFTAIIREASYAQITPSGSYWIRIPPFGTIILILFYLAFVLGLEFYNVNYSGAQHWQAKGLRAGWLTVTQFPLLILLAGKNNLIGYVAGVSYERLQVLHRWVARAMLLTATLHGGFQAYGWSQYGVLQIEIDTDSCIPTGFATWMILLWLTFSSMAPIRNWQYEFFVIQHVITFVGFLVAVFYHIPVPNAIRARNYIWIGIGIFIFDRLTRLLRFAFNNTKPGRATFTSLPGDVTKIRVQSSSLKNWKPGQHVFLYLPAFGIVQSHPATIASVPSSHDSDLIFFLRAHKGFTKRILSRAAPSSSTLDSPAKSESVGRVEEEKILTLIHGPYGASHSDFAAFDTTLLIAGSTGVTFTLPILLDIAHRASSSAQKLPVRRLVFVWIVRNTSWTEWISDELQGAFDKLHGVGIEVEVKIFVTCDPKFFANADDLSAKKTGCCCDVSAGPCCCCDDSPSEVDRPTSAIESANRQQSEDLIQEKKSMNDVQSRGLTRGGPLPFAALQSGRPNLKPLIWGVLDKAKGETGIAVCGPLGLSSSVRTTVAVVSDERGASKGTGAEGIYLHCEGFHW